MIVHLVDDEEIILEISSEIISEIRRNAKIMKFRSGKEYFDYVTSSEFVKPNVVLLDIRMPELNGFEILERFEAMDNNPLKGTRLYVVSSTLAEKDHEKALSFKTVSKFLQKPLDFDEMMNIFG